MKLTLMAACAALLCLFAVLAAPILKEKESDPRITTTLQDPGCKPQAPIEVEVIESTQIGNTLRIAYTVTAEIDATSINTSIELPDGGVVLSHVSPISSAISRGESRLGSARIRLPKGVAGVDIHLLASISFAVAQEGGRIETQRLSRTISFGEKDRTPDLPEVKSGEQISLDMNAVRSGGDR